MAGLVLSLSSVLLCFDQVLGFRPLGLWGFRVQGFRGISAQFFRSTVVHNLSLVPSHRFAFQFPCSPMRLRTPF